MTRFFVRADFALFEGAFAAIPYAARFTLIQIMYHLRRSGGAATLIPDAPIEDAIIHLLNPPPGACHAEMIAQIKGAIPWMLGKQRDGSTPLVVVTTENGKRQLTMPSWEAFNGGGGGGGGGGKSGAERSREYRARKKAEQPEQDATSRNVTQQVTSRHATSDVTSRNVTQQVTQRHEMSRNVTQRHACDGRHAIDETSEKQADRKSDDLGKNPEAEADQTTLTEVNDLPKKTAKEHASRHATSRNVTQQVTQRHATPDQIRSDQIKTKAAGASLVMMFQDAGLTLAQAEQLAQETIAEAGAEAEAVSTRSLEKLAKKKGVKHPASMLKLIIADEISANSRPGEEKAFLESEIREMERLSNAKRQNSATPERISGTLISRFLSGLKAPSGDTGKRQQRANQREQEQEHQREPKTRAMGALGVA